MSPPRAEILPDVWLDARLALWLARPRLLVIADPHWGYAASHRARGSLLPAWGDEEIAARMDALAADYRPAEVIWLGDCVHAAEGAAAAEAYLARTPAPVTLVAGNHDRLWRRAVARSLARGGYHFHHGDGREPAPENALEVIGHHHPAVSWSDGAGGRLRLPALVASPRRLVLPAFSPWAAGTPWRPAANEILWAVSPTRVFRFPAPAEAAVPA